MQWEAVIGVVVTGIGYFLGIIVIFDILKEKRDTSAAIAWILIIAIFPYLGIILYFLIAGKVEKRRIKKRHRAVGQLRPALGSIEQRLKQAEKCEVGLIEPKDSLFLNLATKLADFPPTVGNRVEFLSDGETTFKSLEQAINNAKSHIHLEYYIIKSDSTGNRLLELLADACKRGVEVRLIYDWVGSSSINSKKLKPLINAGGKAVPFLPLFSFRKPVSLNFRTHRKIVIIDGKIGFIGGRNIGDEYRLGRFENGAWHDSHIKISGPVIHRLQEIFVEDWMYSAEEELTDDKYFPECEYQGNQVVQIIASGPDSNIESIYKVFFTLINSAEHSVHIVTPYFIPDRSLEVSLQTAAMKGIKVKLLCPGKKTDIPIIRYASLSYYPELIASGVEIYEFLPGMHHAKLAVVDGKWTYIGTANMDIRSFKLNFEVCALIYGEKFAQEVIKYIEDDLNRSYKLAPTDFAFGLSKQILVNVSRLLSPLL